MTTTASTFESKPGACLVAGSREASPHRVQKRHINAKHLLPTTLGEECTTSEYRKFVREFTIWADTAYPDGYGSEDTWGTLNSRLDSGWQDRTRTVEGIERMELKDVW